jgi:hypothetical protein
MAKTKSKNKGDQNIQLTMKGNQPSSTESIKAKLLLMKATGATLAPEDNIDIEALPDYLTEEELDELLVKSGALDKMLAQIKDSKPSKNWQDELDEL